MVSIIIPYREKREHLEEALKSAVAQNYVDFEILQGGDQETLGQNVNALVKKAKGQFIKVLADDDLLYNEWSIYLLATEMKKKNLDMVYASAVNFRMIEGVHNTIDTFEPKDVTLEGMLKGNQLHGGATMYRRELWERFSGWDEDLTMAEEYDWHLKLMKGGVKIGYLPRLVYRYRIWEGNKSKINLAYGVETEKGGWFEYKKTRKETVEIIRNRYRS